MMRSTRNMNPKLPTIAANIGMSYSLVDCLKSGWMISQFGWSVICQFHSRKCDLRENRRRKLIRLSQNREIILINVSASFHYCCLHENSLKVTHDTKASRSTKKTSNPLGVRFVSLA